MKKPIFIILFCLAFSASAADFLAIQLANIYNDKIDVSQYFVSEKLDGVRAYWNGSELVSKQGNKINAPQWFIKNLPKKHIEGELWIGRGKFEEVVSTVKKEIPNDEEWQKVNFMLFDAPKHQGIFKQRLEFLEEIVAKAKLPYLQVIKQEKILSKKELKKMLSEVIKKGGEGLMLHKIDALYIAKRNDDLLKLKTYEDEEAVIIKHFEGKGKFQGIMGAVLVKNEYGIIFKIGSGFSLQDRKNPPPIGAVITYKFYGKTKEGKPRFASFLRQRKDFLQ